MKTLRQLCAATILSLTLAVSVLAGQVETPGVVATATGHIETPGVTSTGGTTIDITTTVVLTAVSVTY